MDFFGADIDSLMQEDELNENIRENGENIENDENNEKDGNEQTDGNEAIKVEPKKRSVRKPQVNMFNT